MEFVLSAVTGELVSRFISFLMKKYSRPVPACSQESRLQRLQQLLLRAHTVVEEADGRYITNSGMLLQLKALSEAMYRGYLVLHTFDAMDEVSVGHSPELCFGSPLKRPRPATANAAAAAARRRSNGKLLSLEGALESLEAAVANMAEFVVLLCGCERMPRRPYDAYLYVDSFMFGRHAEKQEVFSFLLQHRSPDALAVLPIIGGRAAGKKTLVAHACDDKRVRSCFSSILHLDGSNFLRIAGHEGGRSGKVLVVVEFGSEVDDRDWKMFCSSVAGMGEACKVIIISKLHSLIRFGSVKTIFLHALPYDELSYLFRALAFGSANPVEHPRLVRIGEEIVKELWLGWSLVATNAIADVLRRNLNVQFWLSTLNRIRGVIEKNLSLYGAHPKLLVEQGHEVDVSEFALHPAYWPLRIVLCPTNGRTHSVSMKKELTKVTIGDLLADHSARPKEEFNLVSWESRIPPYRSFVYLIPICPQAQHTPQGAPLSGRKRGEVPI